MFIYDYELRHIESGGVIRASAPTTNVAMHRSLLPKLFPKYLYIMNCTQKKKKYEDGIVPKEVYDRVLEKIVASFTSQTIRENHVSSRTFVHLRCFVRFLLSVFFFGSVVCFIFVSLVLADLSKRCTTNSFQPKSTNYPASVRQIILPLPRLYSTPCP